MLPTRCDLDLAVANGHVMDNIERFVPGVTYRQANQLFLNDGRGRFQEVTAAAGSALRNERVSRALAVGDWNDDGRPDLLVTNTNDRIDLLENRWPTPHHWLGVRLRGPAANRFAIGARVVVEAGERQQVRTVRSGGSVLAQSDLRLHFGLGDFSGAVKLTIRWPDGRQQIERTDRLDRDWTIEYAPR